MKRIFQSILNLGVLADHSAEERRRIKIINLLNSVILFFLLIGLSNYFFLENGFPLFVELFFMALAASALYLSYKSKTQIAFLLFTINANLSIFFINQYYPFESGSYLYYFPSIVTIILLNNVSTKNWMAIAHFSIFGFFFVLFLISDFPEWEVTGLSAQTLKTMWYYNIVMTILITAMVSGLLNRLIGLQNTEILIQNQILNQAKLEINTSLKEKEVLLAELNHRVKNNLAIISGLLNLQLEGVLNSEAKQILMDSKNRILSMALVHKMLYKHPELKKIDIGTYSKELIKELLNSSNLNQSVRLSENYENISLSVEKSIPYGLILNEIVTNSIKYVFKSGAKEAGRFDIHIKREGAKVRMVAKDSGSGFKTDMNKDHHSHSLGLFLIKSLSEQLDGEVFFSNDNGAKVELTFLLN